MVDFCNQSRSLNSCEYPLLSGADDAWAQLASLKVFSPSGRMNSLDCIDVIAGANGKTEKNQMTFENARSLKEYLKEAPMISRTRFM